MSNQLGSKSKENWSVQVNAHSHDRSPKMDINPSLLHYHVVLLKLEVSILCLCRSRNINEGNINEVYP